MNHLYKTILFFAFSLIFEFSLFSMVLPNGDDGQNGNETDLIAQNSKFPPKELDVFKTAYPLVDFSATFDDEENDWLIEVSADGGKRKKVLYWAESRFLPKEKMLEKENYRKMLYKYSCDVPDPINFSDADIERIKEFTSKENRKNGAIDPPFLYDVIYDVGDRALTESHIKKSEFLGKTINVHEKIIPHLKRIEEKIMGLPKTDELNRFFQTLTRADGFNWRSVRDTQSRSFHSIGLAVDILPKGYYQKVIYWGWQKQLAPETWWKTPLEKRWMPPKEIRDIFYDEGFIWGGTWIVWDDMHFEYRPELLVYNKEH